MPKERGIDIRCFRSQNAFTIDRKSGRNNVISCWLGLLAENPMLSLLPTIRYQEIFVANVTSKWHFDTHLVKLYSSFANLPPTTK